MHRLFQIIITRLFAVIIILQNRSYIIIHRTKKTDRTKVNGNNENKAALCNKALESALIISTSIKKIGYVAAIM